MKIETLPPVAKPSQVMAWLGFGISLSVLVLIWSVNAFVFTHLGERYSHVIMSLYVLVVLVGGFLGLLGLIFSIIGLFSATKNAVKKWPSVCGVIFCCLSLLSFLVPIVVASAIRSEPDEMTQSWQDNHTETSNGVVLHITEMKRFKCYDNRNGKDKDPAVIRVHSLDKKHEFQTWMQINRIDKNAKFIIKTDANVDYSDVVEVLDLLEELGITNIELC